MVQGAFPTDGPSFSSTPGFGEFEDLIEYKPCGEDTLHLTFKYDARSTDSEHELRQILSDIHQAIKDTPEFRRFVIDLSQVDRIPDEARGSFLALVTHFHKRGGATLCGASDEILEMFRTMKVDRLFSSVESLRLNSPTTAISHSCDALSGRVAEIRFAHAEIARNRPPYPAPRELEYEGTFLNFRMSGSTAVATLNPSILSLYEEWDIGQKLQDEVEAISTLQNGVERVVLNLRGLEYIGSTSVGALIKLHANGGHGDGPQFALCGLGKHVAEVLRISQLDKILNIFADPETAIAAEW